MADWKDNNEGGWKDFWQAINAPIWDEDFLKRNEEPYALGQSGSNSSSSAEFVASSRARSAGAVADSASKVPNPQQYGSDEHCAARKNRYKKRSEEKKQSEHSYGETTKRIGFHTAQDCPLLGQANTHRSEGSQKIYKPGFFTLVFGVFLPLAALIVEVNTHDMARTYFDPFPTSNHVFLFLLIPLSNFLSWLSVRLNISPLYSMMSLASGMALGIAILYTLMLLPITPTFLLLTVVGVGFLGLAPLLSIPVTLLCGITICQLADRHKTFFDAHQLKHLGHLIILVMVIAVELPSTLTRYQLGLTDDSTTRTQAIQWLRQWGSQDVLLRACYERSGEPTDILGSLAERQHSLSVASARQIYYQVTGVSFNSVPIPASFRGTIKHSGLISDPAGLNDDVKDEFDLDPDIAGELVSGVARGLSVSDSSITGSLDSNNGVGILDWNFTFENASTIPREARAKILLPPNAVVTRATLWLDDLQRETTIQERGLARQTYQESVVSHKRDPLLVSMCGQDSVLVQCYPVMKGTKTKIRLHIISPLVVSNDKEESLALPTFEERNFAITIPHKIALTGKKAISIAGTDAKSSEKGGSFEVNTNLDNSLLSRFAAVPKIGVALSGASEELTIRPPESSAQTRLAFYSQLPEQEFRARDFLNGSAVKSNRSLTVVVDKSITMAPYINDVVNALKSAPKNLPITIVEVKDGFSTLCVANQSTDSDFQSAVTKLSESKCEGGQSDAAALESVFQSPEKTRGAVLWIHAAQPVADSFPDHMRIAIERNGRVPKLYDLQVASGPNEILQESYNFPGLSRVVRTASLSSDITTFLDNLANNKIRRCATTFGVKKESALPEVAQVQAYKLALARYHAGDKFGAYELAQRYHLVTPVSSAVVTEEVPLPVAVAKNEEAEKQKFKALMPMSEVVTKVMDNPIFESESSKKTKAMKADMKDYLQAHGEPVPAELEESASKSPSRSILGSAISAGDTFGTNIIDSIGQANTHQNKQDLEARMVPPPTGSAMGGGSGDRLPLSLPATNYGDEVGGKMASMSAAVGSPGDNAYADYGKSNLDSKAGDKSSFYRARRKMQIIDESSSVADYRENKAAESGVSSGMATAPRQEAVMEKSYSEGAKERDFSGRGFDGPALSGAVNGTIAPQSVADGDETNGWSQGRSAGVYEDSSLAAKDNEMAAGVPPVMGISTAAVRSTNAGVLDSTFLWLCLGFFAFIFFLCLFKMSASKEDLRKPD